MNRSALLTREDRVLLAQLYLGGGCPNQRREGKRTHSPLQEEEPPHPWICKKSYGLSNFSTLDRTSCPKERFS